MRTTQERYSEYLNSEHWIGLRARKIISVNGRCEVCQSSDRIEGHHIRYLDWYNCTIDDLLALCHRCHALFHEAVEEKRCNVQGHNLEAVKRMIDGLLNKNKPTPRNNRSYPQMSEDELKQIFLNARGGWTKERIAAFGLEYPLRHGWKKKLRRRFGVTKSGKPIQAQPMEYEI